MPPRKRPRKGVTGLHSYRQDHPHAVYQGGHLRREPLRQCGTKKAVSHLTGDRPWHADTHGISRGCLFLCGCSQKVRPGTLTPVCAGSTPAARSRGRSVMVTRRSPKPQIVVRFHSPLPTTGPPTGRKDGVMKWEHPQSFCITQPLCGHTETHRSAQLGG